MCNGWVKTHGVADEGAFTLGRGKPLSPRRVLRPAPRLVSVQQPRSGMAELRYVGATHEAADTARPIAG